MNQYFLELKQPLYSISKKPHQFVTWLLVSTVLGLSSFWLPLIFLPLAKKMSFLDAVCALISTGTLASFGIVVLADGIAAASAAEKDPGNDSAKGIRTTVQATTIILIVLQCGLWVLGCIADTKTIPFYSFQILLTILIILFSVYLYCFRFGDWEKEVAEVKAEDDAAMNELSSKAASSSADGSGVKL